MSRWSSLGLVVAIALVLALAGKWKLALWAPVLILGVIAAIAPALGVILGIPLLLLVALSSGLAALTRIQQIIAGGGAGGGGGNQ